MKEFRNDKDHPSGNLLNKIAAATSLREGPEGVAQILRNIFSRQPLSLKQLSQISRLPLPVLAAVRKEFEKLGITERHAQGIALTRKGLDYVERQLNISTKENVLCPGCDGRKIVIPDKLRPALEKLEYYFRQKPTVNVKLDQTAALPDSSIRRALYMYQTGALEGKSILFVGDDDSVSLAVALVGCALGRDKFYECLTVVEADERIIDFIEKVSRRESFDIKCVPHDLREPLPHDLRHKFDTFETDPPYTLNGMNLFVSRAISGLKNGTGRQGFLSFGHKSPDETLAIHKSLVNMGLIVNELIPGFNQYEGASIIGGSSQIFHLLTSADRVQIIPEKRYDGAIYTSQVSPTTRMYRCLSCKTVINIGQGQKIETIEILKEKGCPVCKNDKFRFEGRRKIAPARKSPEIGEIRPVELKDLSEIVKLEIEIARISFPQDPVVAPKVHRQKLEKAIERGEKGLFVMADGNTVMGWLWVTINTHFLEQAPYGNIRSVAVVPEWRRKGISYELVSFAIDYCRRHKAKWITTKVHVDNEGMKNVYLEMGFHVKHLTMELRFAT